jgi:hypothetical protein
MILTVNDIPIPLMRDGITSLPTNLKACRQKESPAI